MPIPVVAGLGLALKYAPDLIRWVSGDNAGDVADKVANVAMEITGTKDAESAEAALEANPELAMQFKLGLADIEKETEQAYLADRQDARKRDVSLKAMGYRNTRADIMIVCVFFLLLSSIFGLWFAAAPPEVLAIINMAIGAMLKMLGDAFQFEFGSSRGSKEKSVAIEGMAK